VNASASVRGVSIGGSTGTPQTPRRPAAIAIASTIFV
jgi:hypothetical protein